jgi:hypothetical protein
LKLIKRRRRRRRRRGLSLKNAECCTGWESPGQCICSQPHSDSDQAIGPAEKLKIQEAEDSRFKKGWT